MSARNEAYYAMLEQIEKQFPGKLFLKPVEAAAVMGCNIKTVRAAIEKKYNPLPARNISTSIKQKSYIIPITEIARWATARR